MTTDDERVIGAAEFKARCLELMDDVARSGRPLTITKRGHPVARLVPPVPAPSDVRGKFPVRIHGDIVGPTGEVWEAEG